MTRASAALAAESEKSGVLFHGMAGAGKTSCAKELAFQHQAAGRFQAFVWYKAPDPDKDIQLALHDLALAMEKQLPGFTMVHVVDSVAALKAWLPRLTECSKTTPSRRARQPGKLAERLRTMARRALGHADRGAADARRVVADSPHQPHPARRAAALERNRSGACVAACRSSPVVRELPNLQQLLDGKASPLRLTPAVCWSSYLASGVIRS